jgi:uncharacterized protein YbjT (DUF2867 family)
MIGQSVLREAILDAQVTEIVVVGRRPAQLPVADPMGKVKQEVVADPGTLEPIRAALDGADACFWCLGISAAGLSEAEYRRITRDIAVSAATSLAAWNPAMTFVFVSGTGADSTERSRVMWARVKGEAENAVLALPFRRAYAVRPAFIQPMHGSVSRTRLYRAFYAISGPLFPVLRLLAPAHVTTTEQLAKAMLAVVRQAPAQRVLEQRVLEQRDLNALAP